MQDLPVFSGPDLLAPGWVHLHDCPVQKERACRCGTATSTLRGPRAATFLDSLDNAILIHVSGMLPTWVEASGVRIGPLPTTKSEKSKREAAQSRNIPLDYRAVLIAVGEAELPMTRSTRPVHGGDLCWPRGAPRTMQTLRRYLCRIPSEDQLPLLLVRPELLPGQALSPSWADIERIDAAKTTLPEHLLVSAFGVLKMKEGPGWTSENP